MTYLFFLGFLGAGLIFGAGGAGGDGGITSILSNSSSDSLDDEEITS